jgi:hypothetical protein
MVWAALRYLVVTLSRWALGAGALICLTAEAGVGASPGYVDIAARPAAITHPAPELPTQSTATPDQEAIDAPILGERAPLGATAPFDPAWLVGDGATPGVSRAVTLSSVTPSPADPSLLKLMLSTTPPAYKPQRPVQVVRLDVPAIPSQSGKLVSKPDFAGLIDPVRERDEQKCLAQAIYFEARSEPLAGQAAVAQVIFNRIKSGLYPTTICGVVFQNSERFLRCEFTFTCEGHGLGIGDQASWATAVRLAREVTEGRVYNMAVGDATHYHADYVKPYWSRYLEKLDVIGRHIFYRVKPDMPGGVCPGCLLTQKSDPSRTPKG